MSLIRKWRPKEQDAAEDDPFVVADKTVTPTLAGRVNKSVSTSLPFYLVAYPDAKNDAPVTLSMEFNRDGKVRRIAAVDLPKADALGRIKFVANAPIGQFDPGDYGIRFVVRQGTEAVEERFAISADGRPGVARGPRGPPHCIIGNHLRGGALELQAFDFNYVARLAARDGETEQHFASYFGPLLTAKLRSRLRSHEAVEDARQETLMRVLSNIRRDGGLRNPERLGAYVNAICGNVLLETWRSQKRHGQPEEDPPDQADWRPDPESQFVTTERRRLVQSVLAELNAKDRNLLQAAFIEERDKAIICKEFGVDADYLRVLLHRARGRFKTILMKRGETGTAATGV